MTSTISALTTGGGGIVMSGDSSGNLSLLSGATTVVAMTSTGATVTGTLAVSGALTISTPLAVAYGGTGGTGGGTPTGSIIGFGSATPPTGWLACDGANVSRTTYSALFAVISTTFGVGDGTTTFTLPVSARRTMVGSGGTGTATLGNAVGNSGGEEKHTQIIAEIAAHTHTGATAANQGNGAAGTGGVYWASSSSTGSTGSGTAFNVMQPSLIVTYIIKT